MRICLIFPKTTVFEDPMVFPPLGPFWIRAVLEQAGHEVDYIDMSDYDQDDHGNRTMLYPEVTALPLNYDVHMISGTSPQASEIRRVARYLKAHGCTVISGGPHVTNYAGGSTEGLDSPIINDQLPVDTELVENCHILVKYEGEHVVLDALKMIPRAHEFMDKYGRGMVIQRPQIKDLGLIPIPDRKAASRYHYYLEDEYGNKHRGTTMFSSRGCPERCAFCDSPGLWGRGVRYTPMDRVIDEFEQIKSLGFSAIQFYDDILPLHKGRMIQMCQELAKRNFIWRCFFRVDIMSHSNYGKEFVQMMYDHGLREALVGVESGSQRILDGIHKGTTVEQNTLVRKWCGDIGVRFKASVILGLPGETRESMEATRRWILENRPDKVNLCVFIPFTGTPIAKSTEEKRKREYGTDAIHAYDIKWDMDPALLEQEFYAGSRTKLRAMIYTSNLSSKEIEDFYHELAADLAREGISS